MKKYAIIGVVVLGFLVRVVLLNHSFWLDEAAQALESMRPLHQQLSIANDFQPPLYHLVVHFWMSLGKGEWWIRLTSVVPGLVTIIALYLIAKTLWKGKVGEQIGLVSSLLLALSPLHVFYSQELRPYAFAAMWATLSWLMLLKYVEQKQQRFLRVFVIFSAAGLYSMYLYPFLLLSQVLYVWFCAPKLRKSFFITVGVACLLFAPWLPSFIEQLRVGSELRVILPGWSEVVSSPQWKALPLVWLKFVGGLQNVDMNAWSLVYFGVPSAAILGLVIVRIRHPKMLKEFQPAFYWLGVTVLSAWLVSFIVPVLSVKRVLLVLPAFYLCIAAAVVQLKDLQWRRWLVVGFVVFELIGLWSYWTTPTLQREDWRAIHGQIYDNYSADSTMVIFGFDAPFAPWVWYDRKEQFALDTLSFPSFPLKEPEFSQTMEKAANYRTVLVFDYLRDLTDPSRQIESWLTSHGYAEGPILTAPNLGFVREYRRQDYVSKL